MHQHMLLGAIPTCPKCGKHQDGATGGDRAPMNGDYCVCYYCATISRYNVIDNNYTLIAATDEDIEIAKQSGIYTQLFILQELVKCR